MVVGALAIGGFVLVGIFDDLDLNEIRAAFDRLNNAEWVALGFGWFIWVGAQGAQTASLVSHLPVRRGVLAFLGPAAVASLIPGPSDLPVRYSMYQSWGVPPNDAATAVAASGIFSIGSQLILPALAGIVILFNPVEIDGFLTIILLTTLLLAGIIGVGVFVVGSEVRTARLGVALDPPYQTMRRWVRQETTVKLDELLVGQRRRSIDHLDGRWLPTTGATVLTVITRCSLLIIALRFVGIPETVLSWTAIFAVYALVAGITVVPITPGSVGVTEVALVAMLTPVAGQGWVNEVAAGVLIYRLLTWLLVIPAGLLALVGWRLWSRAAEPAQ